jgi:hypothetical protein
VLIFSIAHVAALSVTSGLAEVQLSVPLLYLYGKTLVWAGVGLIGTVGLFTGRRWAPGWVRGITLAYVLWYWIDRLLLTASTDARQSWIFPALLMALIAVLIWWSLSRAKIQRYFRSSVDE